MEQRKTLKPIQWADEQLYEYFSKKLGTQIQDFGFDRMEQAVKELKVNQNLPKKTSK